MKNYFGEEKNIDFWRGAREKISQHFLGSKKKLQVVGIESENWPFFFSNSFNFNQETEQFLIAPTIESAEKLYLTLCANPDLEVDFFPGHDASPYSGIISSEFNLIQRFALLDKLSTQKNKKLIIVSTIEAMALKNPPKSFFLENRIDIEVSDIISPYELSKKLVSLGYSSATTVEEIGTFSRKGEIFDIYPIGQVPIRLHYFDDMIEEIFEIDSETQKTMRDKEIKFLSIGPGPRIITQAKFVQSLRKNIPQASPKFKNLFEIRKNIFSKLADGFLFDGYAPFVSLGFDETQSTSILGYLNTKPKVHMVQAEDCYHELIRYFEVIREDFEWNQKNSDNENPLPLPSLLYDFKLKEKLEDLQVVEYENLDIAQDLDDHELSKIEFDLKSIRSLINQSTRSAPAVNAKEFQQQILNYLKDEFENSGNLVFSFQNNSSFEKFKHLLDLFKISSDIKKRTFFSSFPMNHGFVDTKNKTMLLTETDFFSYRYKQQTEKKSNKKNLDLFAEQISTLKEGDFVIHSLHGVGKYLGLQSIEVGGSKGDFVIIQYQDDDKVYVPVYKLDLVQKHADSAAEIKCDSLKSQKFINLRKKAKGSIKKLAFDLLRLQAERASAKAYAFSPPDSLFHDFEMSFPYKETVDQAKAIENVIEDMQENLPMDHLVCGDVGFGKTEVAMRAAFKAVLDEKQVAVLVPTTVLALQHFHSFSNRFKKFPVKVEYISRFKAAKEVREIKDRLANGDVDILIGTHSILSSSVSFPDLGLVIVDEEQRFGVGHKEKLKLMKSSVDFLTLTATPIPRTLQLAFLGLRDLSLIKTPPPRRQSIKSYLVKEDDLTLQRAIKRELERGGQVFIVHNRVKDIEHYASYIRELVPEASILIAHGQLPERELEKRMSAFYAGKFQVLISTTIIESGIDIPNANTMIIDRAHMYGLSQLHQLRGRIGRSDKKAYAYFVIPKFRKLTPVAEKRLKALQTYTEIGSGFNIANSDLEIRGAGDILGGEQSGHIEAIGLELYMRLLKEAIAEIKGEKTVSRKSVELNTPFPSYIPSDYIEDSSTRLKYYKKLSNSEESHEIDDMSEKLIDMFGALPEPLENLISVLKAKTMLIDLALDSIQVAGKTIALKFNKQALEANKELRDKIVDCFISKPKLYQFSPDFQLSYYHSEVIKPSFLITFAEQLLQQIVPKV